MNTMCGTGSAGRIASDLHGVLLSKGRGSAMAQARVAAKACSDAMRIGNVSDTYLHVASKLSGTEASGLERLKEMEA